VHSTTARAVRAFDVVVFTNQPGEFALLQVGRSVPAA
jgi:hypothetical protein